jgi:hypothetical protein
MRRQIEVYVPPLPPTNETLHLATKPPVLNDHVKAALMDGAYEAVLPYIQAVNDKDAVNKSLRHDNMAALFALKLFAERNSLAQIIEADLKALDHSFGVALRAIKDENGNSISPKTRRRLALTKAASAAE